MIWNGSENEFYEVAAIVLKSAIERFYEKEIIRKCVKQNYFYLDEMEQEYVLKISNQIMNLPDNKIGYKNKLLKNLVKKYIMENKAIVMDGFMNFRTKESKNKIICYNKSIRSVLKNVNFCFKNDCLYDHDFGPYQICDS